MKKIIFLVFVLLLSIFIAFMIIKVPSKNKQVDDPVINDKTENKPENDPEQNLEDEIDSMMDQMTIEEKIAQMLVVYYSSDVVDDNLKERLQTTSFGGIILMQPNITTYEKTKKFVDDLKANSKIPLIISVDQEGGSVQRLQYLEDIEATYIPYMSDLAKANDEDLTYQVGKVMAEELRTLGINVVYAPVADINSNPNNPVIGKRSFGDNSDIVSRMSMILANGLEDNGVIATYKHFPGHGDTDTDSHYSLPVINKSYDELKNLELIPFENAIKNGAKLIMIGHIALPNITGDSTPASLSKKIITDILKNDMGYDGLVITDALNMGALTNDYTNEEIYTKAIEAGVDLLLMPGSMEETINIIKRNISEERINESVKKILTFKYKYLNQNNELDVSYLGSSEHKEIISKISN